MGTQVAAAVDDGLEVIDFEDDDGVTARPARPSDPARELAGLQRIAHAFVETPQSILQELVRSAVELCGADSAGISLEREGGTDQEFFHWIATAGEYSPFLDAILPRYPSACSICLERGRPQLFRVGHRFFEIMGIEAPLVTDGILLPWKVDETRGTIFVMAHERDRAFDQNDVRLMTILADFAALGVRQQRQHKLLLQQARASAAAAMANDLAHRINNPLQSLTNMLFLTAEGMHGEQARELGRQALADVERLSSLVGRLLALPYGGEERF